MDSAPDGRHESMLFEDFERIVRESATKAVEFIFEKEGAHVGLPPDVCTVMFGDTPALGQWWNVRRGELPEDDVIEQQPRVLSPYDQAREVGLVRRVYGRQRPVDRTPIKRLRYIGWRRALYAMLVHGVIRESDEVKEWLGESQVTEATNRRKSGDSFKSWVASQ